MTQFFLTIRHKIRSQNGPFHTAGFLYFNDRNDRVFELGRVAFIFQHIHLYIQCKMTKFKAMVAIAWFSMILSSAKTDENVGEY